MKENPKFPESINGVERVGFLAPLKDLFSMMLIIVGGLALILFLISFSARYVAKYVPFSWEVALADKVLEIGNDYYFNSKANIASDIAKKAYLQNLANELAIAQGLSEDIQITVHYLDDDMVNAFATLGGHVFITQGLLNALSDENALAMVIAHELAHVKYRHPLSSLASFTLFQGLLSMALPSGSNVFVDSTAMVSLMKFSRDMELESDKEAVHTLQNYYGNVHGSTDFFEKLLLINENEDQDHIEILSTHPLSTFRIDRINEIIEENNYPNFSSKSKPLPSFLKK